MLVIGGDVTKKPEYEYDRKRQSQEVEAVFAEVSGGKKLSFLENFRATLSGPQHLPIAKNEEAKRHDRGTISQNEAFVACAGFMSEQCLYP